MTAKPAVLVVEDEVKLARTLDLYLGQRGFTVRIAHDGREALERIAEARPDVIVSDIMMPVMDGYALCRHLRTDPATCTIPFLFLTAKDDDRDRVRGLKMGADDYLAKPCDLAALHARVDALLARVDAVRRIPPDAIRVAGRLAETELLDVLQMLELHEKTGALVVKRDGDSGVVYLRAGKIVAAELGTAEGREPFASLLMWKSGDYCFVPDVDPKSVRLTAGIANVVMVQVLEK
ncbi:MAG: response regulator [Nitrospirae bacterium]|nr:MAG: response regulator [Nitrospirota bacterium]